MGFPARAKANRLPLATAHVKPRIIIVVYTDYRYVRVVLLAKPR
jgi:hypothetical protein